MLSKLLWLPSGHVGDDDNDNDNDDDDDDDDDSMVIMLKMMLSSFVLYEKKGGR